MMGQQPRTDSLSLQASLRAQATHVISDVCVVVADVDRLILAASPKHVYATLFYGQFDTRIRALCYVNVGHNPPMVLRKEGHLCHVFPLAPSGPPLGLLEDPQFEAQTFQIQAGRFVSGVHRWDHGLGERCRRTGGQRSAGKRAPNALRFHSAPGCSANHHRGPSVCQRRIST